MRPAENYCKIQSKGRYFDTLFVMQQKAFNSLERTKFYFNSTLPFWDGYIGFELHKKQKPYALYTCHIELKRTIAELQKASIAAMKVYEKVAVMLSQERKEALDRLGFTSLVYRYLEEYTSELFCARTTWLIDDQGPKIIEVNAERPTFWIETEETNREVAHHFGFKDPCPGTLKNLRSALNETIISQVSHLSTYPDITIGYVCYDTVYDLKTLDWVAKQTSFRGESLSIKNLDFEKKTSRPFNTQTGHIYDALFFWFPLEETDQLIFRNGEIFSQVMLEALRKKSFILLQAIPALLIQPKSVLAYITEKSDKIFIGKLKKFKKYFPETYLNTEKFIDSYFAKPIWGRAGEGCYRMVRGQKTNGNSQSAFYLKQPYVYQALLPIRRVMVDDTPLSLVYEVWSYKVHGKWKKGGVGVRANTSDITDNTSYYLPLGIK